MGGDILDAVASPYTFPGGSAVTKMSARSDRLLPNRGHLKVAEIRRSDPPVPAQCARWRRRYPHVRQQRSVHRRIESRLQRAAVASIGEISRAAPWRASWTAPKPPLADRAPAMPRSSSPYGGTRRCPRSSTPPARTTRRPLTPRKATRFCYLQRRVAGPPWASTFRADTPRSPVNSRAATRVLGPGIRRSHRCRRKILRHSATVGFGGTWRSRWLCRGANDEWMRQDSSLSRPHSCLTVSPDSCRVFAQQCLAQVCHSH